MAFGTKSKITLSLMLCIMVAVPLIWNHYYPNGSWNYRVTVTVETPEGIKTGSAVRQYFYDNGPTFNWPNVTPPRYIKGEAVVVDLGDRGVLFALLNDAWGESHMVTEAFPLPPEAQGKGTDYYNHLEKGVAVQVPRNVYPRIVHFRDPKDPKSVETVSPNDLAKTFGEGVRLQGITVEMASDPVTWDVVRKHLPSYGPETGFMEWFKKLPYGTSYAVGPTDFRINQLN